MSKLPNALNVYNVSKENIEEFKGLDHNERTQNGAWYDMQNMTTDDYPVASVRAKREIVTENYADDFESAGSIVSSKLCANDAVIINDKVSLLQNCTVTKAEEQLEGQLIKNTDNNILSFSKETFTDFLYYKNSLLKNFQDKWCFMFRGEPICNIAGRWYEYNTCGGYAQGNICLGGVVTTDDNWTYPMLIAKQSSMIKIYYNDAFASVPADWNKTFIDMTNVKEFTDKYGEKWYVSQNSAALQIGTDEDTIRSQITGKAQYIGKFTTWQEAATALLDIYYDESDKETPHYFYVTGLNAPLSHPIHSFSERDYEYIDKGYLSETGKDKKINYKMYFQFTDYEYPAFGVCQIPDMSERVLQLYENDNQRLTGYKGVKNAQYCEQAVYEYYQKYQGDFKNSRSDISGFYYSDTTGKIYNADSQQYLFIGLFSPELSNRPWNAYSYDNKRVPAENVVTKVNVNILALACSIIRKDDCKKALVYKFSGFYKKMQSSTTYYDDIIVFDLAESLKKLLVNKNNNIDIQNTGRIFVKNKNCVIHKVKDVYTANSLRQVRLDWIYENQNRLISTKIEITGSQVNLENNKNHIKTLTPSNADDKKSMIKCGTKILVIPDGVIIDTQNGTIQKIAYKEIYNIDSTTSFTMCTCDGDENTFNSNVASINADSDYRIVNGVLQKKIQLNDNSTLWSDISSYVTFYSDEANKFEKYSKGDNVDISIKFNDSYFSDILKFRKGLFEYDNSTKKLKTGSYKIQKVGDSFIDVSAPLINYEVDENNSITSIENTKTAYELTIEKKFPDVMPFGTLCGNRVWLCQKDGHEIYASALGDYTNYYDYSGLNSDSWSANVGSDGEFTGIVNYLGNILVFKEDTLYIIYGSIPSEFSYTEVNNFKGVESGSERSFAIIDNVLYYKSAYGIIAYDGSTSVISSSLGKEKYRNAVAGAYGNKYYVSMQNVNTNKYELFCYDTKKGMWTKEQEDRVIRFVNNGNSLYYVTENEVKAVDCYGTSSEENVEWFVESGVYGYSYPNKKYISRLQTRLYLAQGSTARFYIQYNSDGIWHSCGSEVIGKGVNSVLFPIRPKRCDHMKIKIEGKGECKIYSITKCLEVVGEI